MGEWRGYSSHFQGPLLFVMLLKTCHWQGHGWNNLFEVHQGYMRLHFFLIKNHTKGNIEHEGSDFYTKDSSSPCPALLILKITLYKQQPLKPPWTEKSSHLNLAFFFFFFFWSGEHVPNQLMFLYHSNFKPAAIILYKSCSEDSFTSLLLQSLEQVKLISYDTPVTCSCSFTWIPPAG